MAAVFAVQVLENGVWATYDYADSEEQANKLLARCKALHPESQWRVIELTPPGLND